MGRANHGAMRPRTQPIVFLMGVFALLVGVAVALQQANQLSEQEMKDGWKLLFNGENLKGWTVAGVDGSWVVEDGTLHCTGKGGGGMIYADGVHKNFELKLEFRRVLFRSVQRVSLTLERADLMPLRIEYADSKGTRSLRVYTDYGFPNLTTDDFKI